MKNKKIYLIAIFTFAFLMIFANKSYSYYDSNYGLYYDLYSNGAVITGVKTFINKTGVIPEKLGGKKVIDIEPGTFNNMGIKTLKIACSLRLNEYNPIFKNCNSLETVIFGPNAIDININHFENCRNLKQIVIQTNYTSAFIIGIPKKINSSNLMFYIKNNDAIKKFCNINNVQYMITNRSYTINEGQSLDINYNSNFEGLKWQADSSGIVRFTTSIKNLGNNAHKFTIKGVKAGTSKIKILLKDNTLLGEYTVTVKSTSVNIANCAITGLANKTYTGKAITQNLTIKNGNTLLRNGTDYKLEYRNNINVGQAIVKITGLGKYTGSVSKIFNITPANIVNASVTGIQNKLYTGKAITQAITVKFGNVVLRNGIDYTVEYRNNINPGLATAIITGKGNYTGSINCTFQIIKKEESKIDIANCTITGIQNKIYTGNVIEQSIVVNYRNTELKNGTDYTVEYRNNINPGIATAIITGRGNYTGSINCTFQIIKKEESKIDIASCTITGIHNKVYTGSEITQNITVKYGDTILQNGTDYKVEYKDNINEGTASIIITGLGNYIGSVTMTFQIVKIVDDKIDIENCLITGDICTYNYYYAWGNEITPQVVINDENAILQEGIDYEVEYRNNTELGTATAIITGKGKYTGSKTVTFEIVAVDMKKFIEVRGIKDKEYTGKEITQDIVLIDENVILKEGIDYVVEYENNVNIGTATVKITGKGNYTGTINRTFEIVDQNSPTIEYEKIKDRKYITKFNPRNNMVSSILTKGNFGNKKTKAKHKDGRELQSTDKLGTGSIIETIDDDNNVVDTYVMAIKGDLNGDGKITLTDIARSELGYIGNMDLEDEYLLAADVNSDGKHSLTDITRMELCLVGLIEI